MAPPGSLHSELNLGCLDINGRDDSGCAPIDECSKMSSELHHRYICRLLEFGARPNYLPLCCKDCRITDHFKKLKLLNYDGINQIFERNYRAMEFWESFKNDYKDKFNEELDILKTVDTDAKMSLYDFLFIKQTQLVNYAKNQVLCKIYAENDLDFSKQFPQYGFLLNFNFKACIARRKLIKDVKEKFVDIAGGKILEINAEKLLKKLCTRDLQNIQLIDESWLTDDQP